MSGFRTRTTDAPITARHYLRVILLVFNAFGGHHRLDRLRTAVSVVATGAAAVLKEADSPP